jgi:RimJ/RimL family protein N-acetyltransferase
VRELEPAPAGRWHRKITGWCALCAIEKSGGRFIGRFGPSKPFCWPRIEAGWMRLQQFQGGEYALEDAIAAMDFAFLELGKTRLIHSIRPANTASQKAGDAAWLEESRADNLAAALLCDSR